MAFGFNLGQGRRANVFTDTVSIYVFFGHGHSELDAARMYAEGLQNRWGRPP